eukprot:CAMPEP_0179442788 /NCGR_PEP_ID=MMETSP0799-20121207/26283_1 /TAXON_ID=46947 /ORGANISM="Geminigera cryophila, Strain CCMP2564" /LENGTH=161 /DNA_ID=CAMNT_0021228279 /DNA_START=42 /DNA_END=527 /DNA_ORIENTATION=+
MAGFGGAKPAGKDSKLLDPKKSAANYDEVITAGAISYRVFARIKGGGAGDTWYPVGEVASSPDSPDAVCTLYRKMIVEAAVDMHYQLKSKDAPRAQLELAYSESGGESDLVVAEKVDYADLAADASGFKKEENAFSARHDTIYQQSGAAPVKKGSELKNKR